MVHKLIALALCCGFLMAGSHHSSTKARSSREPGVESVRGYTKKNGTRVAPHKRTTSDGTDGNNWSTKGNINPYTGKPGTKESKK